ncbi:hypothetical protein ACFPRL_06665 [Pseudoclavibacter helvolus]
MVEVIAHGQTQEPHSAARSAGVRPVGASRAHRRQADQRSSREHARRGGSRT